jgi:hypothetical protein
MESLLITLAVALLLFALVAGLDIGHTLTLSWARNGETISQTVTIEADSERNTNVTVPNATTDLRVNIAIDVSELKLLYIHSDQAVTIETNAVDATGGNTLTIAANKPLVWFVGCGMTNPLTADVTDMYITNAGGTSANVKIRTLIDETP